MNNLKKYDEYCKKIAECGSIDSTIEHFRRHVGEHYYNYNDKGDLHLKIWTIGVLNFAHIFEHKFPKISTDDMLFKLCAYHKANNAKPVPPLDADEFIKNYAGPIKKIYLEKERAKTLIKSSQDEK